jgi:hypothetical protein
MKEVGERPAGVLHTSYNDARAETSVYLNGELIGTIPDRMLVRMSRDGLLFDWDAWRAAKLTGGEHRRGETK